MLAAGCSIACRHACCWLFKICTGIVGTLRPVVVVVVKGACKEASGAERQGSGVPEVRLAIISSELAARLADWLSGDVLHLWLSGALHGSLAIVASEMAAWLAGWLSDGALHLWLSGAFHGSPAG